MNLWIVVVLAGLGSLGLRLVFLVGGSRLRLPAAWERVADLVYPAAMAAMLGVTVHVVAVDAGFGRLAVLAPAAVVTALISRWTGSVLGALGAGLVVVFVVGLVG